MSIGVMLFNPFTGTPRHPDDIRSDPDGILVWDGEAKLRAAKPAQPLTAEQRRDIWNDVKYDHGDGWEVDFSAVVDAVEAAHKIGGSV